MEKLNMSNKMLLLVLSIILVLVITISKLIDMSNSPINYDKETAETLIMTGTEIKDRKVYYTLEEIIINYIKSYDKPKDKDGKDIKLDADYPEIKYKYDEYYECLANSYKKYLNKTEYISVAEKFLQKFVASTEDMTSMDITKLIKNTYEIQDDTYICKLYSSINDETAYIGIALDTEEKEFRIFIIE